MHPGSTAPKWRSLLRRLKGNDDSVPAAGFDLPASDEGSPSSEEQRRVTDGERVTALQQQLGIQFRDPLLLREALTHRSFLNEIHQSWPSNERLEFLGDAVLGMITTDYLFHRFTQIGEGELTNLRSALVRTETLARFAQDIDLGSFLFLGRGEELSAGRRRPGGLACGFEALLGALYLDRGYDFVRDFVLRFVEPELSNVLEGRLHRNAKSALQELLQARLQQTPTYHLIDESGPDHAKSFTVEVRVAGRVLARGHDRSKRGAEQQAAELALVALNDDSPRAAVGS